MDSIVCFNHGLLWSPSYRIIYHYRLSYNMAWHFRDTKFTCCHCALWLARYEFSGKRSSSPASYNRIAVSKRYWIIFMKPLFNWYLTKVVSINGFVGLDLVNDDTRPSGHISRPEFWLNGSTTKLHCKPTITGINASTSQSMTVNPLLWIIKYYYGTLLTQVTRQCLNMMRCDVIPYLYIFVHGKIVINAHFIMNV